MSEDHCYHCGQDVPELTKDQVEKYLTSGHECPICTNAVGYVFTYPVRVSGIALNHKVRCPECGFKGEETYMLTDIRRESLKKES